jgi:hypothetical protein
MISPSGQDKYRDSDKHGSGAFGSKRGARTHVGIDPIIIPGQDIYAPHDGIVKREIQVYTDSTKYRGIEIVDQFFISHVHYILPKPGIVGQKVKEGDVIGTAQDISERYPDITKHVHWTLHVNPRWITRK